MSAPPIESPSRLVPLLREQERHELNASQRCIDRGLGRRARRAPIGQVTSMTTLRSVAQRAGNDWFDVQTHLAREDVGDSVHDTGARATAGGGL